MPWLMLVLRLTHIIGGVFWAGSAIAWALFIEPTVTGLGPQGGPFVQRLASRSGYTAAMTVAGLATVAAGIWLFWIDSGGFQPEWMAGGMGATLSLGGLLGLSGAVVGIGVQGRNAGRLGGLVRAVQQQSGGPTPDQTTAIQALQGKLRLGGRVAAGLLAATVVCMACARYMAF